MAVAYLGYKVDSKQVLTAEKRLDGMSNASKLAAKAAGALTVAFGAAFAGGAAINTISTFETSISRVGAVSRATASELEAMRDISKQLGSTTEFSASQAADGLNFLAMAGFNASEAMAALPQVLDLATASGLGLAESADIASNVISGFGLAAQDAARVSDVLAAASSRANTDVSQLGHAMSTVAPISASLGISVEETAAAIGVLSDAGIQGARAGTAMRGVLASLAGPTDQAQAALKKYGLSLEDVNPETNSLASIMGRLQDAGLSTADAMTIFGREAASGALALVDANKRVGELTGELDAAKGAASDMADTMRDNLGGDIKGLRSAVEGLILSLGEAGLTSAIRGVVQAVTALVRGFTDIANLITNAGRAVGEFTRFALGLASTSEIAQRAIDNGTLAMGDQIEQVQILARSTKEGSIISEEAARVRLAEAEALIQVLDATRQLNLEQFNKDNGLDEALLDVQRLTEEFENLRTVKARAAEQGVDLPALTGDTKSWNAELENAERLLAQAQSKVESIKVAQRERNFLTDEEVGRRAELVNLTEQLRNGIVNVKNGQVFINGELVRGVDLSSRLSGNIGAAAGQASRLAHNLAAAASALSGVMSATLNLNIDAIGIEAQNKALKAGNSLIKARTEGLIAAKRAELDSAFGSGDAIVRAAAKVELDKYTAAVNRSSDAQEVNQKLTAAMSKTLDAVGGSGGGGGSAGKAAKAVKSVGDAASGAGEKVKTLAEQIRDTIPSAVTSLSDTLADGLLNGFKGTGEKLIDVFKNMLKKMISLAIANPIKIALGLTGGAAGASGGGGILSGLLGGGKGLLGSFGTSLGGSGGLLTGGGLSSLAGGSGLMGGLGNALGGGGLFNVGANAAAAGGGIMAGLGAAMPIIGIGAALISGLRKKVKELDTGIQGTVTSIDSSIQSFRKLETSRFWGLMKKTSTDIKDMSNGPMAAAIADMQSGIMQTAKTLGFGASAFSGFSHSFNLSLKGLSEDEKARKIAEEIQAMGDAFAGMIPHVSNVNELVAAASQRYDLQTRLLQAQGNESAILARSRKAELDATNALNHGLLRQIWAAEDLAKAQAEAARVAEEAARAAEEAARLEKERQSKLDESIYSVGRTRFEAEMLVAARRRGEVTLNRASQGLSQTQDLVRLDAVEQNTGENTKLMRKLVNYFEGWDVNGIPLET